MVFILTAGCQKRAAMFGSASNSPLAPLRDILMHISTGLGRWNMGLATVHLYFHLLGLVDCMNQFCMETFIAFV